MEIRTQVILERELKLLIEHFQSNAYIYHTAIRTLEGILYHSRDNQINEIVMGMIEHIKRNGNPVDIKTKKIINILHHDYIVEQLIKVNELVFMMANRK